MSWILKGAVLATTALSSIGLANQALAAAAESPSGATIGEVVVTAQKRSERLQEVPAAVTALSADSLVQAHMQSIEQYFSAVPGLSLASSGDGQLNLAVRGVATASLSNPTVGVVIADIPFGSSSSLGYGSRLFPDIDPSDLSQIEVLRGPQGTLYGASSIGGLLKVVPKDPSTAGYSGQVSAGFNGVQGGGAGYTGHAMINAPLSDTLAVRVSAYGRREPGFVDDLVTHKDNVNSQKVYGGMASALWRPNDVFAVRLFALLQNTEGAGVNQVEADSALKPTRGDLNQATARGTGAYTIKVRLYGANITADLGPVDLTSITGYAQNRYRASVDATASYGGVFGPTYVDLVNQFQTKKISQELRLSSHDGQQLEWLAGLFYTHERTPAVQLLNGLDDKGAVVASLLTSVFPTTLRETAAFGDATLHITDEFDIQGGVRYSRNKQTYKETDTGALIGPDPYNVAANSKDSSTTYLATARYRFSHDLMAYGRVATGYRIGGPNPGATLGFPDSYGADTTTNYEIGVKGATADHRLSYELSAYHIDWKNIQLSLRDAATGFAYFANGGKARSDGLEGTLQALPWTGFTVTVSGALNDSELTRDLPAGGGAGFDGDRLPFSSKYSGSVSIEQEVPIQNDYTLYGAATLTYVGERRGNFPPSTADVRVTYPDYAMLDLRWGAKKEGLQLNFFLNNVTNKRGIIGGAPRKLNGRGGVGAPFYVVYTRPRTAGVSITKEF